MTTRVGFVLGSTLPPAALPQAARSLEASGFSTIWISEDYFFTGGVAGAAIALGTTTTISVGIGLLPTYVRHPALTAMEAGALAGAYPGRFILGLGSGVPAWLEQIGIVPAAPLATMRDSVDAVRRLFDGESVSRDGRFTFRDVSLAFPPAQPPQVYIGATGPKMTSLAGEVADGVLMSVLSTPEFVARARRTIDAASPNGRHVSITAFAIFSLAATAEEARAAARPVVAGYLSLGPTPLTDAAGISDELVAILDRVGRDGFESEMPDAWIDSVAVCGDAQACIASIEALRAAGADEVALMPVVDAGSITDHINEAGRLLGLAATTDSIA
ncbi:LLM class flavin-dependent oxidoreductase [Microbacterium trichothecenolyticum]|uniref:LLM class flavin-dependent oxidoreductase n=1 Tax=Microbacterium ureisolvens TaxID=2781186 RepID=A0ABS7I128_9MICO|nr:MULTISPECIES: LLM class flavin-dependent oxidoreductase [Microbacterium]MBW9110460.1 LLM class flavin-dependent oxidoreductase [Microbacterium ureisolvens]MBW9120565.1 LLM class flavin-dependent oxidoreductase [Microbacterium trichothecenolyticum]